MTAWTSLEAEVVGGGACELYTVSRVSSVFNKEKLTLKAVLEPLLSLPLS